MSAPSPDSNDQQQVYTHETLAQLANFSLEEDASASNTALLETDTIALDGFDTTATNQQWSSNPLIQMGFGATVVGLACLALYTLANNVDLPKTALPETPADVALTSPSTIDTDGGIIKTSMAFGQEEKELAALSQTAGTTTAGEKQPKATQETQPDKVIAPKPASVPVSASVPPVASTPIVTPKITPVRYVPPAPRPAAAASIPTATPVATSIIPAPPQAQLQPQLQPKVQALALSKRQQATPKATEPEAESDAITANAAVTESVPPQEKQNAKPQQTAASHTLTLPIGTRVQAVAETPILVGQLRGLPALQTQLRLTEAITSYTGQVVLPKDTLLIAEAVTGRSGGSSAAYLQINSVVMPSVTTQGEEQQMIPIPANAVIALAYAESGAESGAGELFQNPDMAATSTQSRGGIAGINWQQALMTGAVSNLDLGDNPVLSGVALDILGQLNKREAPQSPQPYPSLTATATVSSWTIPAGTELLVHINQPVSIPVQRAETGITKRLPAKPNKETPPIAVDTASDHTTSLVGLGSVPHSTVPVVLRPDASKTLSFLLKQETILNAWVSDPDMVSLSYDQPLSSDNAAVIQVQLNPAPDARDAQIAAQTGGSDQTGEQVNQQTAELDVITQTATGKRRWHRFALSAEQ